VWRLPAWRDELYISRLYEQAVVVPGSITEQLGTAARDAGTVVAIGVNKVDGGTLYNTLFYLDADG
jgi:predicted amidohydrolase